MALLLGGGTVEQFFRRGHRRPVRVDQRRRDLLRRALRQQFIGERAIIVLDLDRREQHFEQAGAIPGADIFGARHRHPFRGDPGAAQHAFHPLATRIGDDQDRGALSPGPAGAARSVLQRFRIARDFDMHDQAQRRQIETARRHVCGDAYARALIAQRLDRVVAFGLAVLTGERDRREAPLGKAGVEMPHIIPRGAEQHRRFRFVKAKQVDDGMFDVRRGDGDRLIGNVAMPAILADGRDAQRILLIAFGELNDRPRHGCGEQQRAARLRRLVEQCLEIVAKAHVEHLVCLVEHRDLHLRQIERASFAVILQPAGRADDDMRAVIECAAFAAGVHPADAGGDRGVCAGVEPAQFLGDLQREFARRRDDQRERLAWSWQRAIDQQLIRHRQAERHRLARSGLRGDEQIVTLRLGRGHRGLDGGELGIATCAERVGEEGRQVGKGHESLKW